MILYKKLPCTCGHEFLKHEPCADCLCNKYDPAGHNPELENIVCPECTLARLELVNKIYLCPVCSLELSEIQVLELVG